VEQLEHESRVNYYEKMDSIYYWNQNLFFFNFFNVSIYLEEGCHQGKVVISVEQLE